MRAGDALRRAGCGPRVLASGAGLQRLGARWAAVTRGEGGVGHAEMGKTMALGPSWVLGRGSGTAGWAGSGWTHAGKGKGRVGLLLGWVGFGCGFGFPLVFFSSFSNSIYSLISNLSQTKVEFK